VLGGENCIPNRPEVVVSPFLGVTDELVVKSVTDPIGEVIFGCGDAVVTVGVDEYCG
jgi:hypothetical protein